MTEPKSYMETSAARLAFRDLFCRFYEVNEPIIELVENAQYNLRLPNPILGRRTLFLSGYGFNTSTPIPPAEEIEEVGNRAGFDQIIIPNVRDSSVSHGLEKIGFVPIREDSESIAYIGSDWRTELRNALGSINFNHLARPQRRAAGQFELLIRPLGEVSQSELNTFDGIFGKHEVRYGHKMRLYCEKLFHLLKGNMELGQKLFIAERKNLSGSVVQAMLWLESESTLFYLAQAIDRNAIDNTQNLYKTSYVDIYERANLRGLNWVNLGRGNASAKRKLGATRVHSQRDWLRVCSPNEGVQN